MLSLFAEFVLEQRAIGSQRTPVPDNGDKTVIKNIFVGQLAADDLPAAAPMQN